jgi:uncharacterized protein
MDTFPLYDAAVFGDYDRVRSLIAQTPDVVHSIDKYGFTALHGVVGESLINMAILLIDNGADVDARNNDGIAPLHLAADPEMVQLLVERGAHIDSKSKQGDTPLHIHCTEPDTEAIIDKLIRLGANVNLLNKSGLTPLDIAEAREEEDKIGLLLEHGAKHGANNQDYHC